MVEEKQEGTYSQKIYSCPSCGAEVHSVEKDIETTIHYTQDLTHFTKIL